MKKVFVVGCLLMFSFVISAQQGGGQGRGGFQMTPEQQAQQYERMKSELSLTDKQIADIKKIDEEFAPKQRELMEKMRNGGDREKMREEMTKLNEERNAKVKPLLSAEQYTKYVEMFSRVGGRPGGGGGGNR